MHPRWKEILGSVLFATVLWTLAISLAGCAGEPLSTREKGTLGGAAIGAGGGALIGEAVGHPGAGAAIGGVTGGVAGYAIGNEMQNHEDREREDY